MELPQDLSHRVPGLHELGVGGGLAQQLVHAGTGNGSHRHHSCGGVVVHDLRDPQVQRRRQCGGGDHGLRHRSAASGPQHAGIPGGEDGGVGAHRRQRDHRSPFWPVDEQPAVGPVELLAQAEQPAVGAGRLQHDSALHEVDGAGRGRLPRLSDDPAEQLDVPDPLARHGAPTVVAQLQGHPAGVARPGASDLKRPRRDAQCAGHRRWKLNAGWEHARSLAVIEVHVRGMKRAGRLGARLLR